MARVFILIILFWLLFVVVKRLLANVNAASNANRNKEKNNENIVRCSQCGLYVPESESKTSEQLTYCSNPDCLPKETQHGNQ